MKKLLLVTILALGATQAFASSLNRPISSLTPNQIAYQQKFGQCLQAGWTASQCYQALNAMPSPQPAGRY